MLFLNRNQCQVVNYFQSKTGVKPLGGSVSQEPVSNDFAETKYPQDGVKVPKEAFGQASVVLKKAFEHCRQERHILVTLVPYLKQEITQGENFNMKLSDELSIFNNFTGEVKMITDCIKSLTNFEVFDYGFGVSETDILDIIRKMKDPHSLTVLVAHADICRGFEWPTVIRVNLLVKDEINSTDLEITIFYFTE